MTTNRRSFVWRVALALGFSGGARRSTMLCLSASPIKAEVLYVSPGGPLATLDAARDRIRALRRGGTRGPFTVLVHGGTYYLESPLVLTPEDSGVTAAN